MKYAGTLDLNLMFGIVEDDTSQENRAKEILRDDIVKRRELLHECFGKEEGPDYELSQSTWNTAMGLLIGIAVAMFKCLTEEFENGTRAEQEWRSAIFEATGVEEPKFEREEALPGPSAANPKWKLFPHSD